MVLNRYRLHEALNLSQRANLDSAPPSRRLQLMLRLLCALVLGLLFTGFAQANAAELYLDHKLVDRTVAKAAQLPRIHALIVAVDGQPIVERVFHGPGLD